MYNIYPVSLITNKQPSCDLLRLTAGCLFGGLKPQQAVAGITSTV